MEGRIAKNRCGSLPGRRETHRGSSSRGRPSPWRAGLSRSGKWHLLHGRGNGSVKMHWRRHRRKPAQLTPNQREHGAKRTGSIPNNVRLFHSRLEKCGFNVGLNLAEFAHSFRRPGVSRRRFARDQRGSRPHQPYHWALRCLPPSASL